MRKNVFNKGNRNKLCDVDRADAFVLTNLNLLCVSNVSRRFNKENRNSDIRFTNIQDVNRIFTYINFFSRVKFFFWKSVALLGLYDFMKKLFEISSLILLPVRISLLKLVFHYLLNVFLKSNFCLNVFAK